MADTKGSRDHRLKGSASSTAYASAVRADAGAVAATFTELLTPKETAAYRRCSVRKLDRERAESRGCPYVRIDGRILYRRADVDRFIESHVRGAGKAGDTSEERAV
jgi:hypothetical protein